MTLFVVATGPLQAQFSNSTANSPTFDCSNILGRVFDDTNRNGYQDQGENGLANVRLYSSQGLQTTTDSAGRFHITCPQRAGAVRGSNFIIKLDTASLPTGYRLTTENPRVKTITHGRNTQFNFGASVYREVRLDVRDSAFVNSRKELKPEREAGLDDLINQLKGEPSVLRLAYVGQQESKGLAASRLNYIAKQVTQRWKQENCCYALTIETEIYFPEGAGRKQGRVLEIRP